MAPRVEAAIHELMDLVWNLVYDLRDQRDCWATGCLSIGTPVSAPGWTGLPATRWSTPVTLLSCSLDTGPVDAITTTARSRRSDELLHSSWLRHSLAGFGAGKGPVFAGFTGSGRAGPGPSLDCAPVKEPGRIQVRWGTAPELLDQGDEWQQQQFQDAAGDQQGDEQNDDGQVKEENASHGCDVAGGVPEDGPGIHDSP